MKSINDLATKHHAWVESKGWHNKSALESVALIASEIGEALEEVYKKDMQSLELELADIYLRSIDLAVEHNIDLDNARKERLDAGRLTIINGNLKEQIGYLTVPLAKIANLCRTKELDDSFNVRLVEFLLTIECIATLNKIDLFNIVEKKIEINLIKDTKGRIK